MIDGRNIRKVERILGCQITQCFDTDDGKIPDGLEVFDWELGGKRFTCKLGPPSKMKAQLSAFHESIYKARAQEKFRLQKGLCAICGGFMKGTSNTECDHIESRGAHGRDDRLINLRIVHGEPCHRERHTKGTNGRT